MDSIQDRIRDRVFTKICRYRRCKTSFETNSPGQRYCCPEHGRLQNSLRRSDSAYYKKNSISRRERSRLRKIAVKILNESGIPKTCWMCGSTEDLDAHHLDGNPEHNILINLVWACSKHHALIHHPPSFNRWQLLTHTTIVSQALFCKTVGRLVICTTIKCPGIKHCIGVDPNERIGDLDEGRKERKQKTQSQIQDADARERDAESVPACGGEASKGDVKLAWPLKKPDTADPYLRGILEHGDDHE